jgi:hypothetical protein
MSGVRRFAVRLVAPPLALLLAALPATAQTRCATAEERTAFEIRALRTELMVAWLSCRALPGRDFLPQINGFLQRHRADLQRHDVAFTGHFQRIYGPQQGRVALDRYMTSLANDYSRQSMNNVNFCDEQVQLFQLVEAIDARDLVSFAGERARVNSQLVSPTACPSAPAPVRPVRPGAASARSAAP